MVDFIEFGILLIVASIFSIWLADRLVKKTWDSALGRGESQIWKYSWLYADSCRILKIGYYVLLTLGIGGIIAGIILIIIGFSN